MVLFLLWERVSAFLKRILVKRYLLLLSLLSVLLSAKTLPSNARLVEGMLPNGFSYSIMHNEKPKDKVEFRLYVKAGSLEEEEDQRGLAHFIEHMAFNGTKHFKKNELVSYLESIGLTFGGDLNANTGYGRTLYKLSVPIGGDNVDKALTVLQDWAGGLRFNPEEFNKERGVILEEKRLRNTPSYRLYRQYSPLFFDGTKYNDRMVIGKEQVIKHAPVQRAVDFYKKWYRPELMHLVVVGDIDVKEMKKKIKETFGGLKNSVQIEPVSRLVPPQNKTRIISLTDKELHSNSAEIDYLERKPGTVTEEEKRDDLVVWMTSLLFNLNAQKEVLKPESKALSLHFDISSLTPVKRMYRFSAYYKEANRAAAFEQLYRLMWRFGKYGFAQKDFETVRTHLLARNENSYRESNNTKSAAFASQIVRNIGSGGVFVDEAYDYTLSKKLLHSITLEEVNKRFRKILGIKDRVIIFVGTSKNKLPHKRVLHLMAQAKKEAKKPKIQKSHTLTLLKHPLTPVKIIEKHFDQKTGIYFYRLENNVTVSFKPTDFRKNEVLVSAVSPGGFSTVPTKSLDAAIKAADWVVPSAPGDLKSYELKELMAGKQLSFIFSVSRFGEVIDAGSSTEDLASLFQLLYMQITAPKIDPAIANQERNILLTDQAHSDRDPAYRFEKGAKKFYYRDNPRIQFDTKQSIEKLDPKEMLALFKKKFGDMNHFHFIIVGDTTPKQVEKLISTYLGNLPTRTKNEKYDSTPYPHRKGEQYFVKRFNTTNIANIALQYQSSLPYSIRNAAIMDAVQNILTVRLRNLIREARSGTYGIGVQCRMIRELHDKTVCTVGFAADPARRDELIKAVRKSIAGFIAHGPTAQELKNYKTEFAVQYKLMQKENRFWSGMMMLSARFDTPIETYLKMPEAIHTLTVGEIKAAAKTLFGSDLLVTERLPEKKK